MDFTIIVAIDKNRGIGKDNKMPWHISADLKHFKKETMGGTVIMGRKTWESIPEKYRPFTGRLNIVLSSSTAKELNLPDGVLAVTNINSALMHAQNKAFVIGGAQIFNTFINDPNCKKLIITEIDAVFHCDVFFPELPGNFKKTHTTHWHNENNIKFRFLTYERE